MSALTLLLPVTRSWTMDAVCEALLASDIPRDRCILVLDGPGCEAWEKALRYVGFDVDAYATGGRPPNDHSPGARQRHLMMRQFTQRLVPDGPLLCLEDDTLVPPDVYAALRAALNGRTAATGVQVSRHGAIRAWGVWKGRRTLATREQNTADACGHFCLLTTGETYRSSPVDVSPPIPLTQVDYAHTRHMAPIGIAWDAVCGHLTRHGVLTEAKHVHAYLPDGGSVTVAEQSIDLPGGLKHWYDDTTAPPDPFKGDGRLIKEAPMVRTPAGELYRCKDRVKGNGVVLAAPKQLVPIETAREWARRGFINDPALYDPREESKPFPVVEETKATTVAGLRAALSALGLSTSGNKAALETRLAANRGNA